MSSSGNSKNLLSSAASEELRTAQVSHGTGSHGDSDGATDSEAVAEYANDDDLEPEGGEPREAKEAEEPSYKHANALPFFAVCLRMEKVWMSNDPSVKMNYKVTKNEKLKILVPPNVLRYATQPDEDNKPGSIFPLYRLLMPDKDGTRRAKLKEKKLATMYAAAFNMPKGKGDYNKLFNFSDPKIVGGTAQGVGDFSLVLFHVLGKRIADVMVQVQDKEGRVKMDNMGRPRMHVPGSTLTIGEINELLDKLAKIPEEINSRKSGHDWRGGDDGDSSAPVKKKKEDAPTVTDLQVRWVKNLIREHKLSRLEHKWLVRIIMETPKFGLGWKQLLEWYHPLAVELWTANNSLKGVCNKLCFIDSPEVRDLVNRQNASEDATEEKKGLLAFMAKYQTLVPVKIGVPFSPMRSERTGFQRVLADVSKQNRFFLGGESGQGFDLGWSLAVRHPAFCVETKLDGERLLVHIHQDGRVKIHTRSSTWYSDLYSPVLGPAIRKAVEKHGPLDIILDGEVLSWDNARQETVPFGNNRTIANLRNKYMKEKGMTDPRDENLHADDHEHKSMNASNSWDDNASRADYLAGEECWLEFVAFDVVYIDGPGAADMLLKSVSAHVRPELKKPGSIIQLDGFERKKLLYRLIDPQEHQVEIVPTEVIRPDGTSVQGTEYFAAENPIEEYGFPAYTLDSMNCVVAGVVPGMEQIDIERRNGNSDHSISQARAHAVDKIYKRTVEAQRLEGLLFKDLCTPYMLGEISKSLRFWLKFKPDFFNGSSASDLDLVIVGAYFASGLRLAGKPSSFLVACVDSANPDLYYPVTKVNAVAALGYKSLDEVLARTKYHVDEDGELQTGDWKPKSEYGNGKDLPDFVSPQSPHGDHSDWKISKMDYPDLWIEPEKSFVVTVNAGEIVYSDAFSLGLSLRFPRITKLRIDGDYKKPQECETSSSLWDMLQRLQEERSGSYGAPADPVPGSQAAPSTFTVSRFLTEDQFAAEQKKKRSRGHKVIRAVETVPRPSAFESEALRGLTFVVLDGGSYRLCEPSIDVDEAKEQGWNAEASLMKTGESIEAFIKKHGGKVHQNPTTPGVFVSPGDNEFVLGGSEADPKVINHIQSIENALVASSAHTKKDGTAKAKTKKSHEDQTMAQQRGVLRWTFVFSLVHRWLSKEENKKTAIKNCDPALLEPTVFDYLVTAGDSQPYFGELVSVTMLRRAMEIVGSNKRKKRENEGENNMDMPHKVQKWQTGAMKQLGLNERWVMSSGRQSLWPYPAPGSSGVLKLTRVVILYPDMFGPDFGNLFEPNIASNGNGSDSARWKSTNELATASILISSTLPLARVMGALVSAHLHQGVTHVLCELKEKIDHLVWPETSTTDCFDNVEQGQRLLNRLEQLHKVGSKTGTPSVALVSSKWIRKTWETSN